MDKLIIIDGKEYNLVTQLKEITDLSDDLLSALQHNTLDKIAKLCIETNQKSNSDPFKNLCKKEEVLLKLTQDTLNSIAELSIESTQKKEYSSLDNLCKHEKVLLRLPLASFNKVINAVEFCANKKQFSALENVCNSKKILLKITDEKLDKIANLVVSAANQEYQCLYPLQNLCQHKDIVSKITLETLDKVVNSAISASYVKGWVTHWTKPIGDIAKQESILLKLKPDTLDKFALATVDAISYPAGFWSEGVDCIKGITQMSDMLLKLKPTTFKKLIDFSPRTSTDDGWLSHQDKESILQKMLSKYPIEKWKNEHFNQLISNEHVSDTIPIVLHISPLNKWTDNQLNILIKKAINKANDKEAPNNERFKLLISALDAIPKKMIETCKCISGEFLINIAHTIENSLDIGHTNDATNLLNSLMKKINQNDLHGIGEVGHEFRKILSNIVKKSLDLYKPTNHNQDSNPLHLMFELLKKGILLEHEAADEQEEHDAPFSTHLNKVVDYALENTMNGNGELGNKLLSLAQTSSTNTQQYSLLKGHEVFRGKDKAMLYRLLSSPITAQNKENISKMLKQMLPLYDAGHFSEGGTFGVLLPKIVDFIKNNPSEAGFWNINDLPQCDFKKIYIRSFGNLDEMKRKFNLSEPKQSVDKLSNPSSIQIPSINSTGTPINISTSSVQRPQETQIFRSNYNSSNVGRL